MVDVPAKLAARVRVLSTGDGRTSDAADATSVGITALTRAPNTLVIDQMALALRALVDHRDDVVQAPYSDSQPATPAAHPTHPDWRISA